ncbi:MAG: pilus assembly protein [Pseudomonadota bacterium]
MSNIVSAINSIVSGVRALRHPQRKLSGFARNEDGNIFILFAFLIFVLVGFVGAGVDYTRFHDVKSDIIESMDAAALAVVRYQAKNPDLDEAALKDYGRRFFHENFRYDSQIEALEIDFTITSAKVIASVDGSMKTTLLRLGFFDEFDMHTTNEIGKPGSGQVELALVLDVTGSMGEYAGGAKKIDSLRDAVDNLIEVLDEPLADENAKIAIIPFNNYVNPGGASSWRSTWGDTNAQAMYHGARFFHVDQNGNVDMDVPVNHYNLFDSVPGTDWMGCVEARPYPLDELDTPPGSGASSSTISGALSTPDSLSSPGNTYESRAAQAFTDAPSASASTSQLTSSANSRWVPMFVTDGLDCDANWRGRCPYFHGNSYWSRTDTFTINGSPTSINYWRSWFVDPSYDGQNEGSYENRNFIDDEAYIGYYGGTPTARYAKIVSDFRNLGQNPYSLSGDHQAWKDMLSDYGIQYNSEFYDTDITSSNDSSTANAKEYIMRMAYVGWWDPGSETYLHKFNLNPSIDESISDSDSSMLGPNLDCPAPILPLTNNVTTIENHMDKLFPNGATNSANGAIWGWRVLSPGAPFTEGASYDDSTWQKAVVIMTDGVNTAYDRSTHFETNPTTYGYGIEERMGQGINDYDEMRDEYDNKLLRICQRMKDEQILVYTIVFGLNNSETEKVFRSCATKPSEPYYYKAPSGSDLEDAFGEIAENLQQLHISR